MRERGKGGDRRSYTPMGRREWVCEACVLAAVLVLRRVQVQILLVVVPRWRVGRLLLLLLPLLLPLTLLLSLKGGGGKGAFFEWREDALLVETDTACAGPRSVAFDLRDVGGEGGREGGKEEGKEGNGMSVGEVRTFF